MCRPVEWGPSGPHPLQILDCTVGKKTLVVSSHPAHLDPGPRSLGVQGIPSVFLLPPRQEVGVRWGSAGWWWLKSSWGFSLHLYDQSVDGPASSSARTAWTSQCHYRELSPWKPELTTATRVCLAAWWDDVAAALCMQFQHLGSGPAPVLCEWPLPRGLGSRILHCSCSQTARCGRPWRTGVWPAAHSIRYPSAQPRLQQFRFRDPIPDVRRTVCVSMYFSVC